MATPSMLRIERLNYLLGGILVLGAALTQSRPVALGIAVGVALTCLNFFALRRLVVKWTADAAKGQGGSAAPILMLPKMALLMGAVAVAILVLPIDPIAFTIGYSLFIVSIVIDTVYSSMKSPETTPEGNDNTNG